MLFFKDISLDGCTSDIHNYYYPWLPFNLGCDAPQHVGAKKLQIGRSWSSRTRRVFAVIWIRPRGVWLKHRRLLCHGGKRLWAFDLPDLIFMKQGHWSGTKSQRRTLHNEIQYITLNFSGRCCFGKEKDWVIVCWMTRNQREFIKFLEIPLGPTYLMNSRGTPCLYQVSTAVVRCMSFAMESLWFNLIYPEVFFQPRTLKPSIYLRL